MRAQWLRRAEQGYEEYDGEEGAQKINGAKKIRALERQIQRRKWTPKSQKHPPWGKKRDGPWIYEVQDGRTLPGLRGTLAAEHWKR